MESYLWSGLAAAIAALALTPFVRRAAWRLDIVDRPDGHRKLHGRTVPLGGGVAVLLAWLGVIVLFKVTGLFTQSAADVYSVRGLVAGALVICFVGLLDDRFQLRGRQKLYGQIAAVSLVIGSGLVIEQVELFGWQMHLGIVAIPFTMFWMLGAINSLNLIDGVDGLATTIGIIISVAVGGMSILTGHAADAFCALTLAGALLGFLFYNRPPARIFLGDSGSMMVGLVLGALAIRSSLKGPFTVALAAPTAIWAVLIFDVGMAILRRKLTGQSLYITDRGHLHHLLQARGLGHGGTVLFVGGLCSLCAGAAFLSVYLRNEILAVAVVSAVLATLVLTRLFGHSECRLLLQRLRRMAASLVRVPLRAPTNSEPMHSRFQGNRDWESLWESLLQFADAEGISFVQFNVNAPAIGEVYHVNWHRPGPKTEHRLWRSDIPLSMGNVNIGRLVLHGTVPEDSSFLWVGELLEGLRPFETQLRELLADPTPESETTLSTGSKRTASPEPAVAGVAEFH